MAVEDYIEVYRILISIAFVISAFNWIGYTVLAPWYKSVLGRIIWTKFLANMLILLVPFLQIMGSEIPYRREFSIFAMALFIIAIALVGFGVYTTQLKGYIKKRLGKLKKEKVS